MPQPSLAGSTNKAHIDPSRGSPTGHLPMEVLRATNRMPRYPAASFTISRLCRCSVKSWRFRWARNYRALRAAGVTVRKTPDLIIGTYCIEHGHTLLHADRDFEPMREHLGHEVV
jgi:hypothetical protein